jgi:photosystem II stability/assembly factor-like uncharacterized protein
MRPALMLLLFLAATSSHAQWTLQTSNTTADLRGIHNVGNGIAWASGTNGTVLRTEDGGYVWQSCSIPPRAEKLDFRGIQAFDANTAIVMSSGPGDQSRLYKTTDGCHSWKLLFTNPHKDGFWDAVKFSDAAHGFIFGDPVEVSGSAQKRFELEQTYDGGNTWRLWEEKTTELESPIGGCGFAASNSSLFVHNRYFAVFASGCQAGSRIIVADNNIHFFCHCYPMPSEADLHKEIKITAGSIGPFPANDTSGIFSIASSDGQIMAVGGDYKKPDAASSTSAFTTDSGKTWLLAPVPPHGYRSAVAYDPTTKSWITVGPNGTDISTDDGKNWRALRPDAALHETPDADRNWNALSLPFVVGPHGRIGKLDEAALKH